MPEIRNSRASRIGNLALRSLLWLHLALLSGCGRVGFDPIPLQSLSSPQSGCRANCDKAPPSQAPPSAGVDCLGASGCSDGGVSTSIFLEAECSTRAWGSYRSVHKNVDDFSGNGHLLSASDSQGGEANRVAFETELAPNSYRLYFRVRAVGDRSDGLLSYRLDEGEWTLVEYQNASGAWLWIQDDALFQLDGHHTVEVAVTETELALDKLALVPKLQPTPQGQAGSAENCTVTCEPSRSCASAGLSCGTVDDGCGTPLDCGSCNAGQSCNANVCECVPSTCEAMSATCGTVDDGCGTPLDCGSCNAGQSCNANVCECVPSTCEAMSATCGTVDDGCGTPLHCGSCNAGQSCNANVCECVPSTCEAMSATCGTVDDGCGTPLHCGSCNAGQSCNANVCVAPSCSDSIQNQDETDVDCGGSCSEPCADGLYCAVDADCQNGSCGGGTCQPAAAGPFQMISGEVVLLAVHPHRIEANGDSWSQAGTSMHVGPDDGTNWFDAGTGPRLSYDVNVDAAGSFYVHLYGIAPSGLGDSVYLGVDGIPATFPVTLPIGTAGWGTQAITFSTTGIHTIDIWAREDGIDLIKVVVNHNPAAPVGSGPAESPRN